MLRWRESEIFEIQYLKHYFNSYIYLPTVLLLLNAATLIAKQINIRNHLVTCKYSNFLTLCLLATRKD